MEERTDGNGSAPRGECDLVMRGGVTSGAVYPSALMEIAKRYKLRNVGGASAGAIAAVGAAACEYGRRRDPAAFDRLTQVIREITEEGFVRDLFQPKEETRLAFDVGLRVATSPHPYPRRVLRAGWDIVRGRTRWLVAGASATLVWAGAVSATALAVADGGPTGVRIAAAVVLSVLAFVGIVLLVAVLALGGFARGVNRALEQGGFGLCRGRTESRDPGRKALTEWLHETIQHCADRNVNEPLTFRDLQGDDPEDPLVSLRLVTTDLSASRPVVLPLPEPDEAKEPGYLFERGEFERLFPQAVVRHLIDNSSTTCETPDGRALYTFPGLDLPVVVAARLSLSFPILLETVPLWRKDGPDAEPVRHTMSDGGISSNFPIHFFDSLLPGRPTFGLDLQPWRTRRVEAVEMSPEPRAPLFTGVSDLATFGTQILNAARNWRDNLQAELPGYRDRICQIRLAAHEGGLNLDMNRDVVRELVARGREAGQKVVDPSGFDWDTHRVTRFRTLMQMLQQGVGRRGAGRDCVYSGTGCDNRVPFRDRLEACATGTSTLPGVDAAWCQLAMPTSDALVQWAMRLGSDGEIDFDEGAPSPKPTMRIVPAV
jgi:predicted acylesterase/phospholipase RssA